MNIANYRKDKKDIDQFVYRGYLVGNRILGGVISKCNSNMNDLQNKNEDNKNNIFDNMITSGKFQLQKI